MADATTMELRITANTSDAEKELKRFAAKLENNEAKYQKLQERFPDYAKRYQDVAQADKAPSNVQSISGASFFASQFYGMKGSGKSAEESAKVFAEAFDRVNESANKLFGKNLGEKFSAMFEASASAADKFGKALTVVAASSTKIKFALGAMYKLSPFPKMAEQLRNLKKPLDNFAHALKRIVMYRVIRGGLTALLNGWKEGLTNLYNYSATFGTTFKASMDSISSDLQYVHNGIAALAGPLINAVAPAVEYLAAKFVELANAAGLFFAKITGANSFSAAVRGTKAFNELGGAAKEAKKQLMGFDELNVMNAPSAGGGGAGADYGKMFEEWSTAMEEGSIEARIREAIENGDWHGLGELLAEKMNDLTSKFGEGTFGTRLGEKFQKGLSIAHGFMTKYDFKNAGSAIATNLNNAIANIDWHMLGETLAAGITAGFDFVIGFIETFDSAKAASALSELIKGWFDHLSDWITEVDWESFGKTFFNKVYEFVTGIDFAGIAKSFFTALGSGIAAAWEFITGFVTPAFTKIGEYFDKKTEECGGSAVLGFLAGVGEALVNIVSWAYNNVVLPFVGAVLKGLGVEGGVSTMFSNIGTLIIDSLLDGLKNSWAGKIIGWVNEKVRWLNQKLSVTPTSKNGMDFNIGVGAMAEGGTVPSGQLFIANEAGPELVGSVGGRTTVTSQDQFTAGMADIMDVTNTVIMQAAQNLMQTIANKDMTAVAVIGDREVVRSYDRGKALAGRPLVE